MKTIIYSILLLFPCSILYAQTYTTGVVNLDTDYTARFDVNTSTNKVTMTLIGPDNRWLGIGPGISTGLGMGNLGDDAVVYNSTGLEDRNMPSGTGMPNLDSSQDWSVSSNTTNAGVRTLIATRDINTGDSNDYVFPSSASSLPILWAKGSSLSFGYHGSNKSGTVANLTLSQDTNILNEFKLYPNPVTSLLKIELPGPIQKANIEVYNSLGKIIYSGEVTKLMSSVDVTRFNSGLHLVKLTYLESTNTKRFVKY
ncbi:T9SS type A sorting domain-containing protein [Seonamhaeicola maritimus]|uniref:T9SS type A sorting domain-containing protein n=1 Tax=Seonamhaeicola maritimus TaxID=2591822 RepID=A0A5C7GN03_9FLAO|nr:T9SS type A sorting domain-containing protein [Seonamhaeicola maritimus]TXG39331.1 T9SS type A sorting domain-containing protein [Seonamhaeicola maritimus]